MPPKQAPEVKAANPMVEKLLGIHNSLPLYYYVFIVLPLVWGLLYLFGLLRYLVAWYFFCLFFSPHASWETCKFYLLRSLRPYKHYPIYFNITPLGVLCSRFFLIFPFDTLLYYIDEIVFPGYKNVEIKDPFLVVGQPRSGTTKFESILEEDHDMVCMKLYECRFPYLCFQFAVDAICHLDATYLNGAIEKFVNDYQILHAFDETNPERSTMRRLRFNLSDEDDTIFLFHFFVHFQIYGAFPDPECTRYSHYFENLSTIEKKRMMEFHKKAVQKLLYRKGPNKRYFGKWVLAWCGAVQEAMKVYPDLKIVVMVREPEDQLRSWFKLQGLLSKDLTGYNVMIHSPEVREEAKKINLAFYHKEIDFLKNMSKDRYFLMNFADYYGDIQGNSRHIYKFLGKEIVEGSSLDKFLKEQTQQQRTHKATVTDDSLITSDEIKKFPDLPRIFFEENFSKTD